MWRMRQLGWRCRWHVQAAGLENAIMLTMAPGFGMRMQTRSPSCSRLLEQVSELVAGGFQLGVGEVFAAMTIAAASGTFRLVA